MEDKPTNKQEKEETNNISTARQFNCPECGKHKASLTSLEEYSNGVRLYLVCEVCGLITAVDISGHIIYPKQIPKKEPTKYSNSTEKSYFS